MFICWHADIHSITSIFEEQEIVSKKVLPMEGDIYNDVPCNYDTWAFLILGESSFMGISLLSV